jgi:hypothetical protein
MSCLGYDALPGYTTISVASRNNENATIVSSNLELSQRQGHIRDVHSFKCKFILYTKLLSHSRNTSCVTMHESKVVRTPACIKTCNSQDAMFATWRKKGAQLKRMRLWKPPHAGLSHDADVSFCLFCLTSWCLSWRSWYAAALKPQATKHSFKGTITVPYCLCISCILLSVKSSEPLRDYGESSVICFIRKLNLHIGKAGP